MDNRLKKQSDFNLIFKKGKRCYGKSLMIIYLKKNQLKVGISVSKKIGKAVVRNRVKRLLRACIRDFIGSLNDNYYFIIVPKCADSYFFNDFKENIAFILKKEKLIND